MPVNLDVVIPAHNANACLELTLSSLVNQSLPKDQWTVVVVDDGSDVDVTSVTDRFRDALPMWVIRLDECRGRSAARNAGTARGRAPLILFLDADGVAGSTLLERHVNFHGEHPDMVLGGARHDIGLDALDVVLHGREYGTPLPLEVDPREVHGLVGPGVDLDDSQSPWLGMSSCNLSMRRSVFEEVGGFDEAMTGWGLEDLELCYRVYRHYDRRPGHFTYDPAAYTMHLPQLRDKESLHREADLNLVYLRDKYRHYDMELLQPHRWPQTRDAISYCSSLVSGYVERTIGSPPGWALNHIADADDIIVLGRVEGMGKLRAGRTVTLDYSLPESDSNLHLLGLSLPFHAHEFDRVVNVDMWMHMSALQLSNLIHEGLRVARSLDLVDSGSIGLTAMGRTAALDPAVFGYVEAMLRARYSVEVEVRGDERLLRICEA